VDRSCLNGEKDSREVKFMQDGSLPNIVLMVGRFGLELFFFNSAVAQSTKSFFCCCQTKHIATK
jgi:hypothetical protein